ncbi:MAG: DUF3563 family protein [Betaproteobacteria bacterium]
MNLFSRFISWIFDASEAAVDARAEAWLAQSVDLKDLEWRMRALDEHRAMSPIGRA